MHVKPWQRRLSCKGLTIPSPAHSSSPTIPLLRASLTTEFSPKEEKQWTCGSIGWGIALNSNGLGWKQIMQTTQPRTTHCPSQGDAWHLLDTYQQNIGTERMIGNNKTFSKGVFAILGRQEKCLETESSEDLWTSVRWMFRICKMLHNGHLSISGMSIFAWETF